MGGWVYVIVLFAALGLLDAVWEQVDAWRDRRGQQWTQTRSI